MKHLAKKAIVTTLLTLLAFAAGVTRADNRVYPTVTSTWPRIHGASGTKQTAVTGYKVGADDYDFAGQSVTGSQRAPSLFSLVPSTGVTTPVVFTDGTTANFDEGDAMLPLASGNYAWFGTKLVTVSDTRGSIFIRNSAGAAVTGVHTFGTTSTLTRFNKAVQISGGTYDTKLVLVGFTTQAGNAGAGDIYFARTTAGSTITAEQVAFIGTANEDEAYAIVQVNDSTVAVGGRTKSGSNNDFYVKLIRISNGTAYSGFTLSGTAGTGNDDVIKEILVDGDGNLVLIGSSGTGTGKTGYISKVNPTTGALIAGYEYFTTGTDIDLVDAYIMSNGHIVATGRSGNDLFLTEIQDNGSAYVMDWEHAYDSGRTGDVGNFVTVQADSTILVAGNCADAGASTDAIFWLFDAPALQSNAGPTAFNLLTPTDGASVTVTPSLTWEASSDTLLGYPITYELTWADNSAFTGATVVSGLDTNAYDFTGGLTNDNTYYWKVKALDGNDNETLCTQDPNGWSFVTPTTPPNAMYVTLNSTVESTIPYLDNTNLAGFDPNADDLYDALDVPEPPVFGNNYISTYFFESGFTGFRQRLAQDFRSTIGKNFVANSYLYNIRVTTDQSDSVALTFDVTTNNTDNNPVVFWNGTDFQNMLGASDASNLYKYLAAGTTGSPETTNLAVLIGDATAPVVTPIMPAASGLSEISRSSSSTLTIGVDNTSPVRRATVAFSPEPDSTLGVANDPRENWTTLSNMPITPTTPDDPTDGITNANLTYDWIPATDDPGIFGGNPSAVFPTAQLRYITEDWAGNIDTTYVDFAMVPDVFAYTGDYPAGWHLLSVPLTPDASLPADVFLTHTGNDSGIAGGFTMFQYSVAGGYVQPSSLVNGKGYWMVLDEDNTAAASNSGLGSVQGTLPGAAEAVDLAMDAGATNLVGVAVRNTDLGGSHLQADDWLFSVDNFSTSYTWTEATTTADKGGDASIWVDATSLKYYDNVGGDFSATVLGTDNLVPGMGYILTTGAAYTGTLKVRTIRDSAAVDFNPGGGNNNGNPAIDEYTGEWFMPLHLALGAMSNDLSGFGCRNGSTAGWDNGVDVTAPPLPPSGNYVRATVDGQSWNSPFGRYFVTDIRSPLASPDFTASWDFRVTASENGQVAVTFNMNALAPYDLPDGFTLTAVVNGQTYNIAESNVIRFNYTGQPVIVHITATLGTSSAPDLNDLLPKSFAIVNSFPNPFNPTTTVRIALPENSNLKVVVFNTLGAEVTTLANGNYTAGYHDFTFDAKTLASGVYIIRAVAPGRQNQYQRVVLVR